MSKLPPSPGDRLFGTILFKSRVAMMGGSPYQICKLDIGENRVCLVTLSDLHIPMGATIAATAGRPALHQVPSKANPHGNENCLPHLEQVRQIYTLPDLPSRSVTDFDRLQS